MSKANIWIVSSFVLIVKHRRCKILLLSCYSFWHKSFSHNCVLLCSIVKILKNYMNWQWHKRANKILKYCDHVTSFMSLSIHIILKYRTTIILSGDDRQPLWVFCFSLLSENSFLIPVSILLYWKLWYIAWNHFLGFI